MTVSSLRPGAAMYTAAGWPRCAQLKADALDPHRYLKAMGRRPDDHTDRRTYGQTVRWPDVQTARRQDGLTRSKAPHLCPRRTKTIQDDLILETAVQHALKLYETI